MKGKSHSPEQIVTKLREVERLQADEGLSVAAVAKRVKVAGWTIYRWRKQYAGMSRDEAKRLKDLEKENARLKKLLAEKELDTYRRSWTVSHLRRSGRRSRTWRRKVS